MVSLQLFVVLVVSLDTTLAWQNSPDGPLHFGCKDNAYLSRVKSISRNYYEDRQWEYDCRILTEGGQIQNCRWHNDVNRFDAQLNFRCPGNQVIAGVKSRHHSYYEDRVFGFRCCELTGRTMSNCLFTDYINRYDGDMDYLAPQDYAVRGFWSQVNNYYEDRRWKVDICELKPQA